MPERHVTFLLPGDSARYTGGHIYDARVLAGLRARGWTIDERPLPPGFPEPDAAARSASERILASLPSGALVLSDGYATSTLPEALAAHGPRLRLAAFVHHPYAAEPGLDAGLWRRLVAAERLALPRLTHAIVTSRLTAGTLARDFDLPEERITLAYPGTDPAPLAQGSGSGVPVLLAVGTVMPRKDHAALVEALGTLRGLPWRLRIVGNLARFPAVVAGLRARAAALGIADRIELAGELAPRVLAEAWRSADLVVSASRHEGFGMALAEGIACGLPAVAVAAGAIPEWLMPDAALLVPPSDPPALAAALRAAIGDPELRRRLRMGALRLRAALPSWSDAVLAVERALLAAAATPLADGTPRPSARMVRAASLTG